MKSIISSINKKHEHGLIQVIFLIDAVDRLLNGDYTSSNIEILVRSFKSLYKDIFILCKNEEVHLFPYLLDENKNEKIEYFKKEHLQLFAKLRYTQSIIELLNKNDTERDKILELKLAVKDLSNDISSHLHNESETFAGVGNQILNSKKTIKLPVERKA